MTDMEKARPRHSGGPSLNSSNVHPRDYDMTGGQATEPVGGLVYPAPRGEYVAKYEDGETWPVVGFDRRGNALIVVAGEIVRADAFPLFEAQGFAGLVSGTFETGSITEALGVAA